MKKLLTSLFYCTAVTALSSCGNDDGMLPPDLDAGMMTGDAGPECDVTEPTFSAIYSGLLNTSSCALDGLCHGSPPGEATGGFTLFEYKLPEADLYAAMKSEGTRDPEARIAYPDLFVPGEPDQSYLYVKLSDPEAPGENGQMPPGTTVDPCVMDAVKTWIENGAVGTSTSG